MNNIKPFNEFQNNDKYIDFDSVNEEFLNNMVSNITDFFNKKFGKEITKGQFANKAKRFNRSDFTKFVKTILPKYNNLEDKEKKEIFLKKLDKYFQRLWYVAGMASVGYAYNPEFRELVSTVLSPVGASVTLGLTYLSLIFEKMVKKSLINSTDVEISIETELNKKDRVEINFKFYYAIGVKNTYRILYNSFVRLLQKYENKEEFDIEWGRDSFYKNSEDGTLNKPPRGRQHIITTNFYPKEFVNLLYKTAKDIYNERVEYCEKNNIKNEHKIENNIELKNIKFTQKFDNKEKLGDIEYDQRKNMTNVDFYIQKMSDKQILNLAKSIDNLELKYHEPIKYHKVR